MRAVFLFALALCSTILPAPAATLQALALTPAFPEFALTFSDRDGDRLLDLSEITSFTGFATTGFAAKDLVRIIALPQIAGLTEAGALAGTFPPSPRHWGFDARGSEDGAIDLALGVEAYAYQVSGLSALPLPATGRLLLLGLLALAARGKRVLRKGGAKQKNAGTRPALSR